MALAMNTRYVTDAFRSVPELHSQKIIVSQIVGCPVILSSLVLLESGNKSPRAKLVYKICEIHIFL